MDLLLDRIENGTTELVSDSAKLEAWVRQNSGVPEDLLAWHVGELVYDLKATEIRMAQLVLCRDKSAALDALHEHCADVLDYIIPHWPAHLGPLRQRIGGMVGYSMGQIIERPDSHIESPHGINSAGESGIDQLISECVRFCGWAQDEHIVDTATADTIFKFAIDVRAAHRLVAWLLHFRHLSQLCRAILAFCDFADMALLRWCEGTGNLRISLEHGTQNMGPQSHPRERQ